MGSRRESGRNDESATEKRADVAPSRAKFDWTRTGPSVAVVQTVAETLDRDPTELSPLGEVVNPDALDTVVTGQPASDADGVSVSFSYEGVGVTVVDTGVVTLHRPEE